MSKKKVILSDRIYVPIKFVENRDEMTKKYTQYFYDESICRGCENYRDRPHCATDCEKGGLEDAVCLVNTKNIKGIQYMGFPMGTKQYIEKQLGLNFDNFKLVDKRSKNKFDYPVKFTADLRDYQVEVYDDWNANGFGLIKAPPRSGKTVMSLKILIDLGYRVLIIADQKDFLDGFYETIEVMTNLPEIEKETGKKLFGFLEKEEDYENYQIGLATYQKFLHQTDKRMKLINDNFGSLWTDEIHRAGANCFSKFLINCKQLNRGGCSATPKRKDGRHKLVFKIVGPVVAETSVETLIPECRVYPIFSTNPRRQFQGGPASWVYMNKFLCKDKNRNQEILEQAITDIENGRSVVIPLLYRDHITWMVKNINEHFDRTGNNPVAAAFVGGQKEKKKRKEIIDKARAYQIKCVVGVRSLLQLGLNVPRWDTLYYVLPMSNRENWEQESARILTPDVNKTGKKKPLIRMYFDPGVNQSIGCFKTTVGFSEDQNFVFKSPSKMKAFMCQVLIGMREKSIKMGGQSGNAFFAPAEDEVHRSHQVTGRNALF